MSSNVHSPKHYMLGDLQIQVIDVRDALLDKIAASEVVMTQRQIDYWSRAWEYMTRFMDKNGFEDLEKAKWYLDRLIGDGSKA